MTIYGASVGGSVGLTVAKQDARYGHVRAIRAFSSGNPGNLPVGTDLSRAIFYSFKMTSTNYTAMAAGIWDAAIQTWLRGLPSGQTVWVTYYHEPENNFPSGASFAAAQDHFIHLVHTTTGVTANVKVNIIFTAYILSFGKGSIPGGNSHRNIEDWWPTTYVPDMVSFDFDGIAVTSSYFDWSGIGYPSWAATFAASKGIPWSITEFATSTITGDSTHSGRAAYLTAQASHFTSAGASNVIYWDDNSSGGNESLTTSNELSAWAALVGASPVINLGGSASTHFAANGALSGASQLVSVPPQAAIKTSWSVVLADAPHVPGGGIIGDLSTASQITLALRVADPSTVQFTVNGLHPEALYAPLGSDVGDWVGYADALVYRTDTSGTNLVQRFRLNQSADTYDADGPTFTIQFSGVSYKGLLQARIIGEDTSDYASVAASGTGTGTVTAGATDANGNSVRSYAAGIDVANVVYDLIKMTQAGTGRNTNCNYGITRSPVGFTGAGAGNTGILVPTGGISLQVGTTVFDAINQVLAGGDPSNGNLPTGQQAGADWSIQPDLTLAVWPKTTTSQGRHSVNFDPTAPFVLDAPNGNITNFQRTLDISTFANFYVTAGTSSSPSGSTANTKLTTQLAKAVDLAIAAEGRWTRFTSVQAASQTILNQVAAYNLYDANNINGTYTLGLEPGSWSWTDCGVGDMVQIYIQVGPRQVNVIDRLIEIDIASDDDGTDKTINFVIARPDPHDPKQFLGKIFDRLANLELRS